MSEIVVSENGLWVGWCRPNGGRRWHQAGASDDYGCALDRASEAARARGWRHAVVQVLPAGRDPNERRSR